MRVTIIGGGFSGAACALHLLRDHPDLPATVTIIEPRAVLGAGLAYSAASPVHRINVAAARMSVLPERPLHFHDWLHAQGEPARDPALAMPDGRLHPARAVFGRYVDTMLRDAAGRARGRLVHLRDLATGVEPAGDRLRVLLRDGPAQAADAVVLAVSHTAPDTLPVLRGLRALLPDPWDLSALAGVPLGARVCVVGTGLTACDAVAFLRARGHRGPIDAVSRHGLLPRPRTMLPVQAEGDFSTRPETRASGLLRQVRRAMAAAQDGGRPWENVVDALRQQSDAVWGSLDWTERRRLLRHLRTWWDVHRFQSAPQIDMALAQARTEGALRIRAGRIAAARDRADGVTELTLALRNGGTELLVVDAVINCTGPGHRSVTQAHPVLRGLGEAGSLLPDPARLGIWVDGESRVRRADGSSWPALFVAGPLARGTFGELMGLPQVNLQPRAVAGSLARLACAAVAPAA